MASRIKLSKSGSDSAEWRNLRPKWECTIKAADQVGLLISTLGGIALPANTMDGAGRLTVGTSVHRTLLRAAPSVFLSEKPLFAVFSNACLVFMRYEFSYMNQSSF